MNIYTATEKDFKKAVIKIFDNASFIQLPVVK
jgi:hypothetical protein